jgi:hypothetical protein
LDQFARGNPLSLGLRIPRIVDVVAGEYVGVESDHHLIGDAGSKSAGTEALRLLSSPNPLADCAVGVLQSRMTT